MLSTQGRLLRTIMFPRAHDLQFIKQAFYFIAFMFVIATMFYIWDVVAMVRLGVPATTIVLKVRAARSGRHATLLVAAPGE